MIIVKGRELLIPENERYIGTTYDDNSTVRTFRIPRFHEDGMDKSQLDFYVIINYDDGSDPDAVGVTKSVSDDYIVLEWDVGEDVTEHPGCLFLWVRGFDYTGAVRWSSFPGVFYIEGSGTEPTDLSDLEQRISEEDKLIRLAKLYKSQPMTAATVAEMKYRDRIYVYVGDEPGYAYGDWYFWDEDENKWVSGGAYNAVLHPYTVADYGIFPDGSDCADRLQELLDQGINLVFPSGVYIVGKRLRNTLGCSVLGSGSQTTVLKFTGVNAEAGIDTVIGNSGLSTNPPLKRSVTIADITIQNASAVSYAALKFDGSSVISDRTTTGPTVKDVVITGEDTYGWDTGVYLYACNGAVLHNVSICGKRPGGGTYGIRIDTPTSYMIGTEFLITDCRISYFIYDLFANRAEGIAVSNCVFLATNYGIHWESDTGNHPHLVVSNTHLNCTWKNIVTENVYQVLIYGNLIYQDNSNSHNDSRAIHIKGTGTNSVITNNVIIGITQNNDNTTAIEFDSSRSSIKNNIINMGDHGVGILMAAASSKNEIVGNIVSALTRFQNLGSDNKSDLLPQATLTDVNAGISLSGANPVVYMSDGVFINLAFVAGAAIPVGTTLFKIPASCALQAMSNICSFGQSSGNPTRVYNIASDGTVTNKNGLNTGERNQLVLFIKYATV